MGHVIPFFRHSNHLFARAEKEFGHRFCALHIAGQDIVVTTTTAQISVVDRERHIYAFEPFVDLMYDEVAKVSQDNKPILWRAPAEGYVSIFPNPKQMSCAHTGIALLHEQFTQPSAFRCIMVNSLASVNQALKWGSFYDTSVLRSSSDVKVVSLDFLCRDAIMNAQIASFFGTRLLELEPNICTILKEWDLESWRVSYKLPSVLAKRATRLRDWLVDILTLYYALPTGQRPGSVAIVNELYDDYKHAGLSDRDIAGIMLTILWAYVSISIRRTCNSYIHGMVQVHLESYRSFLLDDTPSGEQFDGYQPNPRRNRTYHARDRFPSRH